MRLKVNGKWVRSMKKINDNGEYEVHIPRRIEITSDGMELEMFSQTLKMYGKQLRKLLDAK